MHVPNQQILYLHFDTRWRVPHTLARGQVGIHVLPCPRFYDLHPFPPEIHKHITMVTPVFTIKKKGEKTLNNKSLANPTTPKYQKVALKSESVLYIFNLINILNKPIIS